MVSPALKSLPPAAAQAPPQPIAHWDCGSISIGGRASVCALTGSLLPSPKFLPDVLSSQGHLCPSSPWVGPSLSPCPALSSRPWPVFSQLSPWHTGSKSLKWGWRNPLSLLFYLSLIKSRQPCAAAGRHLVLHFLLVPRGGAGKKQRSRQPCRE